ncbi:hypothetical protein PN497_05165 [Sphaerospermopsis kisseleviana CS-549]|uniref:Uncharacterized protein n=1 Tax=Sphaerospermopsis kisseleviana CS-549 TaxID=3021783 RepID=A0ABT4ZPT8_9CYAN|nr:hypothetical protein [Sphaerospermopsis kisseleviana CS-549]
MINVIIQESGVRSQWFGLLRLTSTALNTSRSPTGVRSQESGVRGLVASYFFLNQY